MDTENIAKLAHEVFRACRLATDQYREKCWEDIDHAEQLSARSATQFYLENPKAQPSDFYEVDPNVTQPTRSDELKIKNLIYKTVVSTAADFKPYPGINPERFLLTGEQAGMLTYEVVRAYLSSMGRIEPSWLEAKEHTRQGYLTWINCYLKLGTRTPHAMYDAYSLYRAEESRNMKLEQMDVVYRIREYVRHSIAEVMLTPA